MKVSAAKFSINDYHQMIESGILAHRHVELIKGLIIEMSPEGTEHTYVEETIASLFRRFTEGLAWVREAKPITLSTSEPEPDIAIVKLPRSLYLNHHPYPEDIYLLIEISKSTLAFDTSEKKAIYAAAEIQDYWVVDVKNKQLIIYRNPAQGDYQQVNILTPKNTISPLAFPDLTISIADIFNY